MTSLRPPLFLVASDEDKTSMKKSPPREVLLIRDASRGSPAFDEKRGEEEAKPPPHVRGRHHLRFSLFLFLLPCFFSLFLVLARLIPLGSG
ncbi:hypothetical protein GW17_00012599 [Ensete ventricosum]|nr:hypothetical protein GW17_00012599 [Ensete ventricosum]